VPRSSTVISIVRLQFLVNVAHTVNPTWDQSDVVKWSDLEIAVGIVCACLPSIRLLLARSMPILFSSTHEKTQRNQYGNSNKRASRTTFGVAENSSRRGEENKTIHSSAAFTLHRTSKDDDEVELVHLS
jgi:hypothetical protein